MIVAESIGGQEWSEANTGTGQSVSDQQIPESIQDTPVSSSSQSPILSSSGYFSPGNTSTPYSHISENEVLEMNQSMNDQQIQDTSVSSSNEDEVFESNAFGDEEKHKQQGGELGDRIRELEQENTYFKGQNLALKSHNKEITEEGNEYRLELEKSEKKVKELECRLKNKLAEGCEENKRLEQVVSALKENLQSKDDEAKSLHNLLKDRMSEIQSTNRANEELQKRLDQHETEISRLRAETTELRNDMKEIVEDLKDDHEKQLVGLLEREKKLTDTISQLDKKNQELVGELNELQKRKEALEAKNLYPSSGMSLADEMSDANKKLEQKESHQQVEKVDISTQTGIEYDSGDCNQETTPKNKVVDSDDFSLFAQGTSNRPECYELGQRNETDRVIDICVEHTLSDQSKIDDSDSDSKNEQKLEEKLSTEQEWSETNEPYDGEYELIKEEHLSQISCNDRLEILRKRGYSESEINEILDHGPSWYTQITIPILDNQVPTSLMDSRDSLRKRVCVWFAQEHGFTENQKKLNIKLLNILQHLDRYHEGALFDYDNGSVHELEKFLENNKNDPDLKVVLDLKRGVSGATVLHAVSGARIYEIGRDHEHRAVGLLLAAGADLNAQDNEGETPLYYAAAIGNGKGVSSLLWKNANLNICNKQGKTPQQIAIDSGHHNVAGLLLTDKQKKLRDKLYYNIRANVSDLIHFTKILKEFLDEHKNNPDLKVVLNIRSERGESEVLEFAERISYFNGAVGAEVRNLFLEVGASCDVLYRVVKEERPFALWRSLTLNQQKRLDDFLYRISKAEDMDKLEKVVDEVIRSGVQLNFNKDFSPKDPIACNWYSSTDYVIKRIGELNKLKRNPKVASDIICKLVSRGAILYNRNSMDVIDELELESKDHRANMKKAYADYINNAHKFIKVVKRATNGRLNDVRMDNSVFYLEYSEDSTINVAMITDEAQKNIQSGKNVIKIGNSVVEIITINGIRNYTDLEDNSDIALIFYTSQGELEVRLCPDMQNKGLIMVKVNNQDLLEQLKNCGEELGKNCLLGGLPVNEAIERGFFTRSGKLCQYSETVSSAAQTVNEKQQLLQDLRNIESNIVKKEKNFDIKTHLIDIFKTLSRFYEEKGDISKTDLTKAAEKESKKLGLESKYNWSKIFGLEEGVIEKAEKQGDKEQKSNIPDDFYLGHAINNGSCFFDSFRQSLEQQKGIKVTVEQLRNECKRFAQDNPPEWFISKIGNDFDEVEGEFVNHGITCNQYINSIGKNEFWGRSDIEGRVLCSKYGVKLHVAESNPLHTIDKQQDPFLHQLIDSSGSKAGKIDCNHNSVLHMVNGGHDHFQPLLYRNKVLAKQTQEQKDSLFYSSLPSCSMDELKIEKASHQHKALLVSRP